MGRTGNGVEIRNKSIRISFTYEGKSHKETIKTGGQPMAPTPRNILYANRLADEIKGKIKHGTFKYADFFPDSPNATTGMGETVADRISLWLGLQSTKAPSTLKGYQVAASWWISHTGHKYTKALKHSDILKALASEPSWTGKTRNNKVSILRQSLALAVRDGVINANPVDGLEPAVHQKPPPDPFDQAEVGEILAGLEKHYGEQITNYFGFKFFTGLRTSESLAIRWESIDFKRAEMLISDAIVLGLHKTTTKTNKTRIVQLNSKAIEFLTRQKKHSFLLPEGWVFPDPKTNRRWIDDWSPREMYWRPLLRKLRYRYRSPYQTRHTYATMLLMAGVAPAYGAKQLGHSVEMFLRTYSKWIDGGQNAIEMGKLEVLLGDQSQGRIRGRKG